MTQNLWAPWRMKFIEDLKSGRKRGCFLCTAALEGNDRERLVLFRGKHSIILMNSFPYNCGHLLISPYKHTGKLTELNAKEHQEIMELVGKSTDIITKITGADAFNCGLNIGRIAGAGITDHIHLHVVPRWAGDSNFMPVLADTRVISEYLFDTYDKLIGEYNKMRED